MARLCLNSDNVNSPTLMLKVRAIVTGFQFGREDAAHVGVKAGALWIPRRSWLGFARLCCRFRQSPGKSEWSLAGHGGGLARILQCAVNRRGVSHRCKSCLGSCRDTPVATEAVARVTDRLKPSGQRPTVGGAASRWAAIGVTLAQVSNVPSRGPTGLHNREGRWSPCEQPTDDHGLARRGKGRGTSTPHTGQHGRASLVRGRASRSAFRGEPGRKSEGLIVPMAFGGQHNRRGGKAPCFEACLTERRIRRVA